ncbi:MAG: hypothetical protein CSA66_04365 [Proteobacteria bacterium]|nr:MAG: hypothetical protein CSA66_04365 [Pseudomonadota bacterium]
MGLVLLGPLATTIALVLGAPAIAGAAEWPVVEGLVRPKLARLLGAPEVDRLLARRDVREALVATFHAWDGVDDHLSVRRGSDGAVVIRVVAGARERECIARLGAAEVASPEPVCSEVVRSKGDDRLALSPDLWRVPPRVRRPRGPKPPQVADVVVAPPPEPRGPVETLLRTRAVRDPYASELTDTVRDAIAEWSSFQDGLEHRPWKDPFLPAAATVGGDALTPPPASSPLLEPGLTANLRDPFDDARMGARLDLPAPPQQRLSRDVDELPAAKAPGADCVERWAARDGGRAPPKLECFRRVSTSRRVEAGVAHQIQQLLSRVGVSPSLPLLDLIVAQELKAAAAHRDYNVTWAIVWLEWVRSDPERLAEAAVGLSDEERKLLRRRLWRWWIDTDLAPYRDSISTLYERHFLALYPEARDATGLPRRAFFSNTFLWASNWLSEANRRPSNAVMAAYRRLGAREQAVIDGFVADALIASRFPASCAALVR